MNKNDLIAIVAEETKLTKADTQRVLEATMQMVREAVKKNEDVRLVGFGTFLKAKRSARKARNPKTGKELLVKAHVVPRFRPGKEFKEYLQ